MGSSRCKVETWFEGGDGAVNSKVESWSMGRDPNIGVNLLFSKVDTGYEEALIRCVVAVMRHSAWYQCDEVSN
jgi:hypothetical protein